MENKTKYFDLDKSKNGEGSEGKMGQDEYSLIWVKDIIGGESSR